MAEPVTLINSFEVPGPDAEDFMTAIASRGFREAAAGLAGYPAHPALYGVVRT